MINKNILLLLSAMLLTCINVAQGKAQKFFNLTADEVRIDSVLPCFTYSAALAGAWEDSLYTVSIEYPEFMEMSKDDVEKCKKLVPGQLSEMPNVRTDVVVERKRGHLEVSFVPFVMRDGKYMKLVSFMLDVKSSPKYSSKPRSMARADGSPADRYAAHSVLATGRWAKIRVPSTGIYELTDALIRRAGFTDMSRVKVYGYGGALQDVVLNGDYLVEHDDLKEVPTCTVNGHRLFHAQGPVSWRSNTTGKRTRNPYSDYGYYFITESDGEPLSVDSTAFVDSFYPSADDYHVLHEVDNYAWFQGGRNIFEDDPIEIGKSKSYIITPEAGQSGARNISVGITSGQASAGKIEINGLSVASFKLDGFTEYDHGKEYEGTFRVAYYSPTDTVTITTTSGGPLRLDYISASYATPSNRPVLAGKSFPVPEYVYNITNQDHHASGPADMVIIIPTSGKLKEQAERLKEFHTEHDGMRVVVVPADELYNEFSSGTPDANAYRRYLKMLYDRAETEADMPSYLVLFGDCVWDNRMNTSACAGLNPDDFLLCNESENSFSDTKCYVDDGFFCCLDDGEGGDPLKTDKLDMAVGRFPVRTADEAKIMVDKTLRYVANENAGSWQNHFIVMGDDGNNNRHMSDAEDMANTVESINPAIYVERIMWDTYQRESSSMGNTYPDVARLLKQRQEAGALVMNYCGHGRQDQISHERVLTITDFAEFTNINLPLWITASCEIMPFDSQEDNIGETAVLNANGGAVAFFGTTRTVYVNYNNAINKAYLRALFTPDENGDYISIGEAQRQAKNYLITPTGSSGSLVDGTENKLQYSLLGDPALKLNMPKQRAVIDSINGVDLATAKALPQLQAGTVVTVKGHINTYEGSKDTDFKGVVSCMVRDAEKLIVCRLNDTSDEGAITPFVYYDRTTTFFNGSDNVENGDFSFSFAVPKDIDYSNESGLINIFALNSQTGEAVNGCNGDFVVGGTGSLSTDSIGPSVYCYLNSPSFVNGGNVNNTPYFVAEMSDKDGINAAGSGIGHDMLLVIDGDLSKTYVLNSNFEYDFGSYTTGRTYYNIPELEPGKHTLKFRAWDIMNNSSTTELTFNVVRGLTPSIVSVDCSSNPATTSTTFIINHDRMGSNLNVEIYVYDIGGRPVWHHKESGVSPSGAYTVDWDLTGSDGGRLNTGVYIYRVKIGSDDSGTVSKANKLVIVNK